MARFTDEEAQEVANWVLNMPVSDPHLSVPAIARNPIDNATLWDFGEGDEETGISLYRDKRTPTGSLTLILTEEDRANWINP